MHRVVFVAAICLLIAPAGAVKATTYLVLPDGSGDFPTIQAAIDGVGEGDVIELGDGTFQGTGNHDVYFNKDIVLRSAGDNPDLCIIDCEGDAETYQRGISIAGGTPNSAVIRGIKIINGHMDIMGGGLRCGGSPTIENCVFAGNHTDSWGGGGVYCEHEGASFFDCRFEENTAGSGGGAYVTQGASVRFERCVFQGNSSGGCAVMILDSAWFIDCTFLENGGSGGALDVWDVTNTEIRNCSFVGNTSTQSGALVLAQLTSWILVNTILAFNDTPLPVSAQQVGAMSVSCCDVFGNEGGDWVGCLEGLEGTAGNISADPLFCDREAADLHLAFDSPCAPEADPGCGLIGALPVGCGISPVEQTSWGKTKAAFRGAGR